MRLPFKKLNPTAQVPTQANPADAGYDLASIDEVTLRANSGRAIVSTGLSVAIPEGFYGRIAPRSGLAAKHGIDVLAGVVDASYRGELKVVLINHGDQDVTLLMGQRIAQLIIEKCHAVVWAEVDELPVSVRGEGGFGSSDRPISYWPPNPDLKTR